MPAEVIMPALGMAQETGRVLRWLRREGDVLRQGEPLVEVETDKVTVEIESPASGTLTGVSAPEGSDVAVGTVIAFVATDDARIEPSPEPRRPPASPKARRLATRLGVAIESIAGTGPNGAVVAADIEAAARPNTGDSPQPGNVWRAMAQHVTEAWQVPQFVLGREVDASRLESWRRAVQRRVATERITHTDLLVKLCAETLRRHPRVNARWSSGAIVAANAIGIGVAVATDDGVVVPVVRNADELDLATIASRSRELSERARAGRLRPADVEGGTFTISNLGMYGVDYFQAILNTPQAAILAVGRITQRPAVDDGRLVVRPTTTLALSFDHRVVDGARGAEFLATLAELIEEPAQIVG